MWTGSGAKGQGQCWVRRVLLCRAVEEEQQLVVVGACQRRNRRECRRRGGGRSNDETSSWGVAHGEHLPVVTDGSWETWKVVGRMGGAAQHRSQSRRHGLHGSGPAKIDAMQ